MLGITQAFFWIFSAYCLTLTAQNSVQVNVPANGVITLAGQPNGTTSRNGGRSAPNDSPVFVPLAVSGGQVLEVSATGTVENAGPDGTPGCRGGFSAEHGIASITSRCRALLGVFLADSARTQAPGTEFLGDSREHVILRPMLQQPFVVGSGLTSAGESKAFVVPAGATRFFLSAAANGASRGSFTVTIRFRSLPETPTNPVRVSAVSVINLAGQAAGVTSRNNSRSSPWDLPAEVVTPLVPGRALRIVANGSVDSTGPDGRPGCRGGFSSEYAIAAITVRCEALVGVFLGDTLRAMPPSLDFMGATRDLVRLEPLLQQPFLVGSGFTDGGQMKQFVIPAGATRLYLSAAADPASAGSFLATVSPESAATPELPRSGVARAAGFAAATLSAGSIASLFGSQFAAESTGATSVPLPSQLGQTRVWFNLRPAPLYFVSPGQVNAQIPWELAGQTNVQVVVTRNGAASLPVVANLAPAAPGIFLIRENAGVVVNASTGRLVDRQTSVRRGEALVIYASGLGAVAASSATGVPASSTELEPTREPVAALVSTNGQASELQMLFAGSAPGFIGVNQVNAIVPLSVPPGLAALRLRTRGVDSNEVLIAIE